MKALVISGFGLDPERGPAALAALESALAAHGLDIDGVDAVSADVRPCVGCGSCGLKTPGRCVVKDEMQQIYPRIVACDVLVLAGPVSFGAHCHPVKKIVDRLQPLMMSVYTRRNGEMKFQARYPQRAAWMGVGLLAADDPQQVEQEAAFRLLLGRHAVNVDAPAHGAAVIAGDDPAVDRAELDRALEAVLGESDGRDGHDRRYGPVATVTHGALAGPGVPSVTGPVRSVLIVQGSPRRKANTRAIVAHLRAELEKRDVATDVFHIPRQGATHDDLAQLQRQLQAAEAVVLVAPLYIDGLPPVTQLLLEQLAARRAELSDLTPRLYGIAHSGFPEPIQRETELRAMALFAAAMGWPWQGGIGFGGTSPIDGRPLDEAGMFAKQLRATLPLAAADIAAGGPFAPGTVARCDKPPFAVPLALVIRLVNSGTRKAARKSGVDLEALPYSGG